MTDDWLSLQQKYWEQWTDMSRRAMGAQAPQANPWEGALDHWWKAFAPAAPDMSWRTPLPAPCPSSAATPRMPGRT